MRVISQPDVEWKNVETWIRNCANHSDHLRILEAGCGRAWRIGMDGISYELVGIDCDADALEARKTRYNDLHEAIVGDLRTAELPPERFDVIYSSYVLEHVSGAEQVMERFVRWLKPGGIIVVRVPDFDSVHGFTTRMTPFWLHVLFYRYAQGLREAGTPGFPPYLTVYEKVVSSRGMHEFAARHGLEIKDEVRHGEYRRGSRFMRACIGAYAKVLQVLSFGRVHAQAANLTFIIEKPLSARASAVAAAS